MSSREECYSGQSLCNMLVIQAVLLIASYGAVLASDPIQCRDENNNPVDWFFVYKFPAIKTGKRAPLSSGKSYMFITAGALDHGWQFSNKPIDSKSTLIANTLSSSEYNNGDNILSLVYNDEGDTECETCGHTKGFVAGDSSGGFWMIHSVPHYLQNDYPETGLRYGQSALCISLKQEQLNSIGDLLRYNQPNFQKWNLTPKLKELYPKIVSAVNKIPVKAPYSFQTSIETKEGTIFQGFAKSRDFNADLYHWVAKNLKVTLFTETWLNERGALPSDCSSEYRVINIMSMGTQNPSIKFSTHKDHSKLAIAADSSKPWVCVGDINRATSQEKRGGGTVCLKNAILWKLYNSMILSTEKCPTDYLIKYNSISNI